MENTAPFSSVWGKLKPRVTLSHIVIVTVGTHSFCVDKHDPYLKLLQQKLVKKSKVFVALKPSGDLVYLDRDESFHLFAIAEVQITDSYKLVSRLQEFWQLSNQDDC